MTCKLVDKLPDSSGKAGIRIWLKSSGYSRRLILGEEGDPWKSVAEYLAYFGQAHALLKPDVAVIDVSELFQSWVKSHPELLEEMGAKKRVLFPLRKMLEADGPRKLLAEIIEAVQASVRGKLPVVIAMPTPRDWIREANRLVSIQDIEIENDDVEDSAMYIADFIRSFAASPLDGVLLEDGLSVCELEDVKRIKSIFNLTNHYRWGVVWRTDAGQDVINVMADSIDAVITSKKIDPKLKSVGLDLSNSLWEGQAVTELNSGEFYFVEVPYDEKPENVLEKLEALRA